MSKKQLTPTQQEYLDLLRQGDMNRSQMAVELFGDRSRESTLRGWEKGVLRSYIEELDITEDFNPREFESELIEVLTNSIDPDLAKLAKQVRTYQRSNNQLRKVQRTLFDNAPDIAEINEAVAMLSHTLPNYSGYSVPDMVETDSCTLEILLSDLQIGKVSERYNTEVAKKALAYYGHQVMKLVEQNKPERIVLSLMGDLMEDHLKHGVQSAISTDTSLAEQMADAIEGIWYHVLRPLADVGVPVSVECIAGNHGSSQHKGMDMYMAGRFGYDYTVYKALETLVKTYGADHVLFNIPQGCFTVYSIYGQNYLMDHGYFTKGCSQEAMQAMKEKRMNNMKTYIHGYRMADKHNVRIYDNGNYILNGAFFGIETTGQEYSGILGFNSVPSQVVVIHRPVPIGAIGLSTVDEVKMIQIAKGY